MVTATAATGVAQLAETFAGQRGADARHQHAGQGFFQAAHQRHSGRAAAGQQHSGRAGVAHLRQGTASRFLPSVDSAACTVALPRLRPARGWHPPAVRGHRVVQEDDADVLDAHAHEALHQALHFIGVAGAHVEDVAGILAQRGAPVSGAT